MEYKYTGIVLSKKDIGEADRIYTIYTRQQGKIRAIAAGTRLPKAKLANQLENFNLVDILVVKNRGMGKIKSAVAEKEFLKIKSDLVSLEKTFEAAAMADKLTQEDEKDLNFFSLLSEYMDTMEDNFSGDELTKKIIFQSLLFKLFDLLGYKQETGACVVCQSAIKKENNYFSFEKGGVVCFSCGEEPGNKIKIDINVIKAIRIFSGNKIKNIVKLKMDKRDVNELERLSSRIVHWIL